MEKKALGRGLGALIETEIEPSGHTELELSHIKANPSQPRTEFDKEKLAELAQSIKENGIIQPIIVQFVSNDNYQIIAGERRARAAKIAGLKVVPVVIANYAPNQILEISLIENIQREELSPIEEAEAFAKLIDSYGYTQEKLAMKVGKSRVHITNQLRLLKLSNSVQSQVRSGELSAGHARTLISIDDVELQYSLSREFIDKQLSVRAAEALVKNINTPLTAAPTTKQNTKSKKLSTYGEKWQNIEQLQQEMRFATNSLVKIVPRNQDSGKIELEFNTLEEFNNLYQLLTENAK